MTQLGVIVLSIGLECMLEFGSLPPLIWIKKLFRTKLSLIYFYFKIIYYPIYNDINRTACLMIDPNLLTTCHKLLDTSISTILLSKNSLVTWFIIVPDTNKIEWYELDAEFQMQ